MPESTRHGQLSAHSGGRALCHGVRYSDWQYADECNGGCVDSQKGVRVGDEKDLLTPPTLRLFTINCSVMSPRDSCLSQSEPYAR